MEPGIRSMWLVAALCIGAQDLCQAGPVDVRQSLGARLDSLEMRLQIARRNGEPPDSIDAAIASVRDSLVALRERMVADTSLLSSTPGVSRIPFSFDGLREIWKLPSTVVDWLIVVIGGIAVISGAILLTSLVWSWRKRRPAKRKALPPLISEKLSVRGREVSGASPGDGAPPVEQSLAAIEELRRQLQRTPVTGAAPVAAESPPQPVQAAGIAGSPTGAIPSEELRKAVMAEAARGLDSARISQKLHIGVDQAELILRLARKKPPAKADT